jgi:hypothetical protein
VLAATQSRNLLLESRLHWGFVVACGGAYLCRGNRERAAEISAVKVCAIELRVAQNGSLQNGAAQIGAPQIRGI